MSVFFSLLGLLLTYANASGVSRAIFEMTKDEAKLVIKTSAAYPQLESTITEFRTKKRLKIEKQDEGIKLQGTFQEIKALFEELSLEEAKENSKTLFIKCKNNRYFAEVERFMNKCTWGDGNDNCSASTNVSFHPAEALYILLENYEGIEKVIVETRSRLRFKDFSKENMRIKIELIPDSKKDELKILLEKKRALSMQNKEKLTLAIDEVDNPCAFLDATITALNPDVLLLRRESNEWILDVVVDKAVLKSKAEYKRKIRTYCQKEQGSTINSMICNECRLRKRQKASESKVKTNGIVLKQTGSMPEVKEETREINVGKEEIIDYMMKVKEIEMVNAQLKYGVEIFSENKSRGILVIRANKSDVANAERWLSGLSDEMIRTVYQESIDLTKLNKSAISESQLEEAKRNAGEHEISFKVEGKSSLLIVGPRSRLSEFRTALEDIFSKSAKRRESTGGATAGRPLPPIPSTPECAKAYRTNDGNITILTWITDITKLHVDAVVNAANERLQHGAGVALAIARTAGHKFDKECSDKVARYGKLATADVYVTTAGNMPSEKVIHTVGPIFSEHRKSCDFAQMLWQTFNRCLEEAHNRGFTSIAFPAISTGIFGEPKDVVAKAAISAIVSFCNKEPFTTVTSIHLVDIIENTILCFQDELDIYAIENKLGMLLAYDYSVWVKKNQGGKQYGGQQMMGGAYSEEHFTDDEDPPKSRNDKEDNCPICMEKPTNPRTLPKCKHTFCKDCIDQCFDKLQPKCPICGVLYGDVKGTQPENGHMKVTTNKRKLPGFDRCGTIVIEYSIPNGIQTDKHPHPGRPYWGTRRTAYLPDNKDGKKVLALLRRAFDACMVFTVGRSSTTGRDNNVIWNCIHHKTNIEGGPPRYGYPDSTYLSRVTEELTAAGFK